MTYRSWMACGALVVGLAAGCGKGESAPNGGASTAKPDASGSKSVDAEATGRDETRNATPSKDDAPVESAGERAARVAFARLIKAHRDEDPNTWIESHAEIEKLGKEAVGVLGRGLIDPDKDTREQAAMLLARLGPDSKGAETWLVQALDDPSAVVRANAGLCLSLFGIEAKKTLAVLRDLLKEGDPGQRMTALYSLGNLGSHAKPAASEIVKALEDDNADVRLAAVVALGNLGVDAAEVVGPLEKLSSSDDAKLKAAAVVSLGQIAQAAKSDAAKDGSRSETTTAAFNSPAEEKPAGDKPGKPAAEPAKIPEAPAPGDDGPAEAEIPAERPTPAGGPALSGPKLGNPG